MSCCISSADDYVDDDNTRIALTSEGSRDSTSTEDSEVLNTDYRKVSPLFRNIEKENWEGVLLFLNTGKWSNSLLSSSNGHLRSPGPEIQVKTWVTAYDRKGEPEWSQLPIHAAISYLAPYVVIQKLIELYPRGIHCTDNEGMLPIHLAFGFGAPDNVISLLLEPFPTSINEKGLGGRYPYECCELGPHKTRGKVYRVVSEQIVARSRREMEQELREFANKAIKTVGIKGYELGDKETTQFILELLQDRKELGELKEKVKNTTKIETAPKHTSTPAPPSSPASPLSVPQNSPPTSPKDTQKSPTSTSKVLANKSATPKNGSASDKLTSPPTLNKRNNQKGNLLSNKSKMTTKPPSAPRSQARNRKNINSNSTKAGI